MSVPKGSWEGPDRIAQIVWCCDHLEIVRKAMKNGGMGKPGESYAVIDWQIAELDVLSELHFQLYQLPLKPESN